jgi:hypothetical protein
MGFKGTGSGGKVLIFVSLQIVTSIVNLGLDIAI